jgi:hypothetical protein
MSLTVLQSSVTKTATFNGSSVDISGLAAYGTVLVKVTSLTAAKEIQIQVQTSADGFVSDIKVEKQFNFIGPIGSVYPVAQTAHDYDMPGIRLGVTSAHMRIALTELDSSASVTYEAYLQQ